MSPLSRSAGQGVFIAPDATITKGGLRIMTATKAQIVTVVLAAISSASAARALDVAAIAPQITAEVNADYPRLDTLYKDIHAHPELGFQETRTAAKLAAEMRARPHCNRRPARPAWWRSTRTVQAPSCSSVPNWTPCR